MPTQIDNNMQKKHVGCGHETEAPVLHNLTTKLLRNRGSSTP